MESKFYTAIDVGESLTKLVRVCIVGDKMHICATYTAQTKGIRNGEIYSKSEVQSTVGSLIHRAEKDSDNPINSVILLLPSNKINIYRKATEHKINSDRSTPDDVKLLHKAISSKVNSQNEIVVQMIPIAYYKDGENLGKSTPDGYRANKIGVDAFLVTMPYNVARGLVNILEDMNITVLDAIPSPIANAALLLKQNEYKSGAVIVDLGGEGTSISCYKDEILCEHIRISKGINSILEEMMKLFNFEYKEASSVLLKYGCAVARDVTSYNIYTSKHDERVIKESDIAIIVETCLESIIQSVKKELDLVIKDQTSIPVIITGFGGHIREVDKKFEEILHLNCSARIYQRLGGRDFQYSTCVGGLISYLVKNRIINPDSI